MKALFFNHHGGPEELRFGEVSDPIVGPGDALIRVRACAANHLDIWVRRGWPGLTLSMPHWCGADVAGDIIALGINVKGWQVGQRVVVDPGITTSFDEFVSRGEVTMSPGYRILGEHLRGGAAERISVPARNLLSIPDRIDYENAAAPLLVSLTAWRMLIQRGRLRAGESVLVIGAGGGVNTMAIQIAKLAGAAVFVVAGNPTKAAHAMALGADVAIDRSNADWAREVYRLTEKKGVDLVVDNVGSATLHKSIQSVGQGGRIVIVGNTSGPEAKIDIRYIFGKQISLIGSTMGTHEDFKTVTSLLWTGRLKPVIDRVVSLADGRKAYEEMESGTLFGKVIFTP